MSRTRIELADVIVPRDVFRHTLGNGFRAPLFFLRDLELAHCVRLAELDKFLWRHLAVKHRLDTETTDALRRKIADLFNVSHLPKLRHNAYRKTSNNQSENRSMQHHGRINLVAIRGFAYRNPDVGIVFLATPF